MKKKFTFLMAALMLLTMMVLPGNAVGQSTKGTKITDYTQIVSGKTYYIGATVSNTDYYFQAAHQWAATSVQGNAVTDISSACAMTFDGSGTTWTIRFDDGKYLKLSSQKGGKVDIIASNTSDIPTFTASNTNNSLISLANNSYYLLRNSTANQTKFGSYAGGTYVWLIEVSSAFTVTYDANGATSGDVPTDDNEYSEGDEVTVLGNTGSLAKTGYTWSCWNTQADGNGTDRAAGSTFNISENTTLYAKWAPKTISGLSCTGTPTKTTYADGESFDPTGLTVTATYTDASSEDVTALVTWTPDPLTTGTTSVTGTYMGMTVNVSGLTVTGAPEWVLTDISDLTTSDIFVIVGTNGGSYSMSNNNGTSNPPAATAVTIANGKIISTVSDNIKWNISGNATDGYTFYPNGSTTTWLYCIGDNNGVRVGTNANKTFELDEDNYMVHKATSRVLSKYNSQWRCYGNYSNTPLVVSFYKYQIPSSVATPTFSVEEGTYTENLSVTISSTDGATIYYTTDGSEPTTSSSTYSSALSINQTTTLKAKAYKNSEWSYMASATYTLKCATPTFSPAGGICVGAQNVNITSTEGATIYYTLDGSTPTTTSTKYTGAISITQTKTVKAIAVKSNWENSEVATATYTVVVPLTTMDAIFTASETSSTHYITFDNWVVSGIQTGSPSKKAYVTDGEKGFVIYNSSGHGFAKGDQLSGTVQCSLSRSNGAAQITGISSSTEGLSHPAGGTVTAANIALADLSGVNTGALVSYNNLSYNGTVLSDGTTQIKPYGDLVSSMLGFFTSGKTYNVTGVYLQYNDTKEILPRSLADVVLRANINATDFSGLTLFTYVATQGGPSDVQSVTISGSDFSGDLTVAAPTNYQVSSDNTNWGTTATFTQSSGTVSGTLYIRLAEGLDADTYNGNLTFTATNFNTKEVALEGTVSESVLYTVSIALGIENGTIESDKNTAEKGEPVTITVTPADCYELATLTYYDGTTTTNIDRTTKQFSMPENNVIVNATFTQKTFTISYSVNGTEEGALEDEVTCGDNITLWNAAKLETEGIDIPARFVLYGWSATAVAFTQTAPTLVASSYVPTEDMTLYAVFATAEEDGYKYTLVGTDNIEQGTYLIGALINGTASNSFYFATTTISSGDLGTNSNATVISEVGGVREINSLPSGAVEFTFTGNNTDGFTITADNTNYLGCTSWSSNRTLAFDDDYSSIAWKVCAHNSPLNTNGIYFKRYTGTYYYTISENGYSQGSAIRGYSSTKDNDKIYRALYLFKKGVNTTYSNYCSLVKAIDEGSIDDYGNLIANVTIDEGVLLVTEPITVPNGKKLEIIDDGRLVCDDPYNLIIEDGGQLIVHNSDVQATIKKNIEETSLGKGATKWYTIASPLVTTTLGAVVATCDHVVNLKAAGGYNLFRYNEHDMNWENYKNDAYHVGENRFESFEPGRGYLYNRNGEATLEYVGEVNGSEKVTVNLSYTGGNELAGFNLIGNPYSHDIYKGIGGAFDHVNLNTGFYRLKNGIEWAAATYEDPIASGEGVLVQVHAPITGLEISNTDSKSTGETPSGDSKANADHLMFTVENAANTDFADVTYAMFDKGFGLNKIEHRNANVPMLYIPQDGEDYAIAMMDDNTNAFNLNFEAKTAGRYTLGYKAKGEFNYIHVIDRITGEDVDMLLDGEYSFIGSPMDMPSRFIVRLGYLPNYSDNGEDIFAYQSDSDIVVSGEGELQIFDVTGRMMSTQRINGVETVSGLSQGVYVFRLIGNEIKTQKIVVR